MGEGERSSGGGLVLVVEGENEDLLTGMVLDEGEEKRWDGRLSLVVVVLVFVVLVLMCRV